MSIDFLKIKDVNVVFSAMHDMQMRLFLEFQDLLFAATLNGM